MRRDARSWKRCCQGLAALTVLLLSLPLRAGAQETLPPPTPAPLTPGTPPANGLITPNGPPVITDAPSAGWVESPNFQAVTMICPPEKCELYLRGGPVFPSGHGFLEDRIKTGWGIEGGARKTLVGWHSAVKIFGEVGGGYAVNDGDLEPVITRGTVFAPPGEIPDPEDPDVDLPLGATRTVRDDFLETRLARVRRTSFHMAVGASMCPMILPTPMPSSLIIMARAGTRVGGIKLAYDQNPTPALIDFVNFQIDVENRAPTEQFRFSNGVREPELFYGFFASAGAGLVCHGWRGWPVDLIVTAEVEIGTDIFDTGDFSPDDHNLTTFTPMLAVTLKW
jgi:hypothetical protein